MVNNSKKNDSPVNSILKKLEINKAHANSLIKKMEATSIFDPSLNFDVAEALLILTNDYILLAQAYSDGFSEKGLNSILTGRKILHQAITVLENIYTNTLDEPYSVYAENIAVLVAINESYRINLSRRAGFLAEYIYNILEKNTKWRWYVLELLDRTVVIYKNSFNLKDINTRLIPVKSDAIEYNKHINVCLTQLQKMSLRYYEKYEIYTRDNRDYSRAYRFMNALLYMKKTLNHDNTEIKNVIDILANWEEKFNRMNNKKST